MPITWNDSKKIFYITTKSSTYQMKVDPYNYLVHTYYGSRIDDTDMYTQLMFADRGFSGKFLLLRKILTLLPLRI